MPNSEAQLFKDRQLRTLPDQIGVYALCDLDEVPIYVGQSEDAIRARVRRHLTSARSDVIANRQIDVWEIAFVWAWPLSINTQIGPLEAHLFNKFNRVHPLIYGDELLAPASLNFSIPNKIKVQVINDTLIKTRKDPALRFPRQVQQFNQLLDYILNVQDKPHLRKSLRWHYDRMARHYDSFLS